MDIILLGILAYFGGGSMGSLLGAASAMASAKAAAQQAKYQAEMTERANAKSVS